MAAPGSCAMFPNAAKKTQSKRKQTPVWTRLKLAQNVIANRAF
jgi:hypothetical protein